MNNQLDSNEKHPLSLRVFFATEMWERYGFYVVQTLLALYMAFHFKWEDKEVYALVSSFTAITYLSPMLGGWIADNLLGQKKTIIAGAVCLFFSYIYLSFVDSTLGLIASLATIAVGTGLLKPNISSLLGNEYPTGSPKREAGFIIFYMGLTTGIILGTTLPSHITAYFGWSFAFLSAAFGMVLAGTVFIIGVKRYQIADYHPFPCDAAKVIKAIFLMILLFAISFYVLYNPSFADVVFGLVVLLSVVYLVNTALRESYIQRRQTIVIGLLCLISTIFWAFYFQMFSSLTLFIARVVEPDLFGIFFPAPYYVAIQSVGMIAFGFLLARKPIKQDSYHSGIATGNKFVMAMIFMLLGYAVVVCNYFHVTNPLLLSPLLIIPAYLFFSIAELLLSPVGLSAITTLASRDNVSTMMGVFFVSLGFGAFLSGKLAYLTAVNPDGLSLMDLKIHYMHTFGQILIVLAVMTLVCIGFNFLIKRLLRSAHL